MNRWYRILRHLAGIEDPPPTRLTREEAIELARAAAERAGLGLEEPIGAGAEREGKARRVVWGIIDNADKFGGHVRIQIDDATGEIIEIRTFPM